MELSLFIQGLLSEGKVSVKGALIPFSQEDIQETALIAGQFYQEDILEMPYTAPVFSVEAILWASRYFYSAVQLAVIREAGEEVIKEQLNDFPGLITPEAIYSADLVLRHLPSLFDLAKGLAPADLLVQELRKTAVAWPFSSVGIELEEAVNDSVILSHPSLKQAYIDRIIELKDKKRIKSEHIQTHILEVTGDYSSVIWPHLETVINK